MSFIKIHINKYEICQKVYQTYFGLKRYSLIARKGVMKFLSVNVFDKSIFLRCSLRFTEELDRYIICLTFLL